MLRLDLLRAKVSTGPGVTVHALRCTLTCWGGHVALWGGAVFGDRGLQAVFDELEVVGRHGSSSDPMVADSRVRPRAVAPGGRHGPALLPSGGGGPPRWSQGSVSGDYGRTAKRAVACVSWGMSATGCGSTGDRRSVLPQKRRDDTSIKISANSLRQMRPATSVGPGSDRYRAMRSRACGTQRDGDGRRRVLQPRDAVPGAWGGTSRVTRVRRGLALSAP